MKILIFVPNFTYDEKGHVPVFFQTRIEGYLNLGHNVEVITHAQNENFDNLHPNLKVNYINKKDYTSI